MLKEIIRTILFSIIFITLSMGGIDYFSLKFWVIFVSLIGVSVVSGLM